MRWTEATKKYGKELMDAAKDSGWLDGITVTLYDDGEENIPEEDIIRAIRAVKGEKIEWYEWD